MGKQIYEVPLVTQGANPICWMACAAMVMSFKGRQSVGVDAVSGLDPTKVSIPNVRDWPTEETDLRGLGFVLERPANANSGYIENVLARHGPFILLHYALGFPYHFGVPANNLTASSTHAVVITGIDTAGFGGQGRCWFNNPWGTRKSSTYPDDIVKAIKKVIAQVRYNPVAYLN